MTSPADAVPVPDGPPAGGFVVSREDVLRVRATLLAEIDSFSVFLQQIRRELFMRPCGGDEVSKDVAERVTERTVLADDSYYATCKKWVGNLEQLAHTLDTVARRYGYTDEEIANSTPAGPR